MSFDAASYVMGRQAAGSGPTLETLRVAENGSVSAPAGVAWNQVEAAVPNSYTDADEGKVVSDGALVDQGARVVKDNGDYVTTKISMMTVSVPTYGAEDAGKVVKLVNGVATLARQGAATVGVNGTIDTTEIGALTIAVAPYMQPFSSPLEIHAAGALELEVILWYNNLGVQVSGATFRFDGTTWSRVRKDGLGTFEVAADADNPSVGIITAEPPSGGTVIRRAYSYVS